ncbi:hypothetical protein R1sor_009418 [Riccia sorocarpa]|uniref:Uncharacterized protein n=1 Tax=Riccia sorocarpa TaxID=122646 RepID=A0ABD3HV16_9MARC
METEGDSPGEKLVDLSSAAEVEVDERMDEQHEEEQNVTTGEEPGILFPYEEDVQGPTRTQRHFRALEIEAMQQHAEGAQENFRFDLESARNQGSFPTLLSTPDLNLQGRYHFTGAVENASPNVGTGGQNVANFQNSPRDSANVERSSGSKHVSFAPTATDHQARLLGSKWKLDGKTGADLGTSSSNSVKTTGGNAWTNPFRKTENKAGRGGEVGELLRPYLENLDPNWGSNVSK